MSGKLVGQVYDLDLPHNEQSIMLALADHGHDDGSHIHPSVPYVAWKTGYTERQVQTILRRLEAKGLIEPVAYATGGRGKATEYQMHIERGTMKPPYRPTKGEDITSPYPDDKGEVMASPYQKGEVLKRVKSATQKGEVSRAKGEVLTPKGEVIASPQPKNLREPEENPKKDCADLSAPTADEPVDPVVKPSRKRDPKLTNEEKAYYAETVPALAEACHLDLAIDGVWAQCQKQLRALYNAQVRPTAATIAREYGQPTGYWYAQDWRGQKGQPPAPHDVTNTWGAATTFKTVAPNGKPARAAPAGSKYDRSLEVLRRRMGQADSAEPPTDPTIIEGRVVYGNR